MTMRRVSFVRVALQDHLLPLRSAIEQELATLGNLHDLRLRPRCDRAET